MSNTDWDPNLYLKFGRERIQPSIDLVSRLDDAAAKKIIDIGCGPGNSTQILKRRWPDAEIVGADNSPAMIKKAEQDYPDQKWILFDVAKDILNEKFDLLFSNATIQWIPNHDHLIKQFAGLLNEAGVLAVQLPLFFEMPLGKSISEIAHKTKWNNATKGVDNLFTIHNAAFYYDCLSKHFSQVDIWTTDYYHVMASHEAILEMIRSTGLKPYLERLENEDEKQEFATSVLHAIQRDYPLQQNEQVLFPFKRLFFVAKK